MKNSMKSNLNKHLFEQKLNQLKNIKLEKNFVESGWRSPYKMAKKWAEMALHFNCKYLLLLFKYNCIDVIQEFIHGIKEMNSWYICWIRIR